MRPPKGRPGRPRKGDAELRRAQLLDDAAALFLQSGYHGVSLAQLAAHGRVAVRTIYQEFGGKLGLLQAILQSELDRAPPAAALPDHGEDVVVTLQGMAAEYMRVQACPRIQAWQRLRKEAESAGLITPSPDSEGFRARLISYFANFSVRAQLRKDLPNEFLAGLFIACIRADCAPPGSGERSMHRVSIAARVALFLRAVRCESHGSAEHFPI
jgi:AcrR family transcriptional regulator